MSDKSSRRTNSKAPRRAQKDNEDKRTLESRPSKKTLQTELQEFQCAGDFIEDFRQTAHTVGLSPEGTPRIIHKPHFSLWRNMELAAPPMPVVTSPRLSDSPTPESLKGLKGGKVEATSKSSLLGSPNSKGRDKDKNKEKERNKKKVSKITTGAMKSDASTPKTDIKSSPSSDLLSKGPGTLDLRKGGERLFTSKGRDKNALKEKVTDESGFPPPPATPLLLEGNDQKPLYVVYEPYTVNRLKEIAIRCAQLVDCGLKSMDVTRLSEVLPRIPNIEFLSMDGNFISDQNHGLVLEKPSALRYLSLRYANLDDKAMEVLANAWLLPAREWAADRPGLGFLDLSRNRITDRGLAYLVQALRFNRSLTTLALPGNLITDYGVELLCSRLLLRFSLTEKELVDRRTKNLQYVPSIVSPYVYSLKRKFRNPLNAVPEKGRPEKEVVDGKKKEKDEIKKNGARMSGSRMSAGNAIKTSPGPASRLAGSAHPERTKTAAKGHGSKHGMSIVKSQAKGVFPSPSSSHSQADIGSFDANHSVSTAEKDNSALQRNPPGSETKPQSGVPQKVPDHFEREIHTIHGGSHHTNLNGNHPSKSVLDLTTSFSQTRIPESVISFVANFDILRSDQAGIQDPRVIDLIKDLSKNDHHHSVITDRDIWLDRVAVLANVSQDESFDGLKFGEAPQISKVHHAKSKRMGMEYQQLLLKFCRMITDGTADIRVLPAQIQSDLLHFCEDPFFMFPDGRGKASVDYQNHSLSSTERKSMPEVSTEIVAPTSPVPKFHLHVTSASLTGVHSLPDARNSHSSKATESVPPTEVAIETGKTTKVQAPSAAADDSVGTSEKSLAKRSDSAPSRSATSASVHRKISLRKTKGKKGDTPENAVNVEPTKECPVYMLVAIEVKFNALVHGIVYDTDQGLSSDGNRTLKILNLMSNKLTAKSVQKLMETISRQREEQSQSLGWQRPQSPVLPASPKSPATSAPSLSKDSGESEANNSQKGTVFPTTKLEEKSYAGKKSGLNKRPVLDSESSAPTAPAEETTVDECQPMIIQKQVVKEKDDPNRNNLGLLFVDLDHNLGLTTDNDTLRVFDKFMAQQRDAYGIAQPQPYHSSTAADRSHDSSQAPVDDHVAALKALPKTNPAQYSLLKGEYTLERKRMTVPPLISI